MALKNSQYDTIMRNYEQKQLLSRDRLSRHYETVYAKLPAMKALEDSISQLAIQQGRKLLDGDTTALSSLKSALEALREDKHTLLCTHGFPPDYLEPSFECPDCQDTGYIGSQKCHCFKKNVIKLLYLQSNLNTILQKENFQTFSLSFYSSSHIDARTGRSSFTVMKNALSVCHEFVDTFSTAWRNLFFYGDTGIGKTFLSNCIAKELMDQSYSVIYFTAFELFDILAKSTFHKDSTAELMSDYVFECDLLIIDDLGTELTNTFVSSQLFLCVNERLLSSKSTIISTNLSLEALVDLYSERTFSRITSNYTMLKLTGDDVRIKKKLMNMEGQ